MENIYRVKRGTKGDCRNFILDDNKIKIPVQSCHKCHGLSDDEDLYVTFTETSNFGHNCKYYYPASNKRSGCTACGAIQKSQLISVNDNPDEMKRFLVNSV